MKWSYGITTVAERINTLLPQTLKSLELAGFDNPRLFIDNANSVPASLSGYDCTCHCPALRAFGNWITAAWSLYTLSPLADYYAIFQDDFVTYRNLRDYLENCQYPEKGYWNLYTFPMNEKGKGWFPSNQRGLGAVALVFNRETFKLLLHQQHMVERVQHPKRGHKYIDGGVVDSLKKVEYREYVHSPSLVQHTGIKSSIGNSKHELAQSFRGESFDALFLLKDLSPSRVD